MLFEAKLANNKEVPTAMREQLIDRYLIPQGRLHGILLVYWIHPDRRPAKGWSKALHPDKETLRVTLQEGADAELKKMTPDDAYMLCSLAADLYVTQAVDVTKGVHASLAKALFH